LRALTVEELDERLDVARADWFGGSTVELSVAAGIAALDSMRGQQFGYPRMGSNDYNVNDLAYTRRKSASEALGIGSSGPRAGRGSAGGRR